MKAVVYNGPRKVSVNKVPDPKIQKPTDAIVRVIATNICGSDLHMYEGRTEVEPGTVLGHENLGEVIEIGSAVQRVKKGDIVCLPFNVSCGFCENCDSGQTGFCLTMNPGSAGAAYGYAAMGPYPGGQADSTPCRRAADEIAIGCATSARATHLNGGHHDGRA